MYSYVEIISELVNHCELITTVRLNYCTNNLHYSLLTLFKLFAHNFTFTKTCTSVLDWLVPYFTPSFKSHQSVECPCCVFLHINNLVAEVYFVNTCVSINECLAKIFTFSIILSRILSFLNYRSALVSYSQTRFQSAKFTS